MLWPLSPPGQPLVLTTSLWLPQWSCVHLGALTRATLSAGESIPAVSLDQLIRASAHCHFCLWCPLGTCVRYQPAHPALCAHDLFLPENVLYVLEYTLQGQGYSRIRVLWGQGLSLGHCGVHRFTVISERKRLVNIAYKSHYEIKINQRGRCQETGLHRREWKLEGNTQSDDLVCFVVYDQKTICYKSPY